MLFQKKLGNDTDVWSIHLDLTKQRFLRKTAKEIVKK